MKTVILFFVALLVVTLPGFAQPDSLWSRSYGGAGLDYSVSVVPMDDGGYALGCATSSFGAGNFDLWLVRTNAQGDTLWCRTYGGTQAERIGNMIRTADGGFLLTGYTSSFGAGGEDIYMVKTDGDGITQWTHTYGGWNSEKAFWGEQASDGGYIIASETNSFGGSNYDFWILKTDANGDTVWTRMLGRVPDEGATCVVEAEDGGFVVCGVTRPWGNPAGDYRLVKLSAAGDSLWSHIYYDPYDNVPWCVRRTLDGGYVVAGMSSRSNGATDICLLRTNANGDSLWCRDYGTLNDYEGTYKVLPLSDGGFVIAGGTQGGGGTYVGDVWLIRTDGDGNVIWDRTFGGFNDEVAYDVQVTPDGGYVISGATNSFGAGGYDVWLIKTGPDPSGPVVWTQVTNAPHPFYRAGSGVLVNYFYCFGTTWPQDSASAQAFNLTTEQWEESILPTVGTGNFSSVTTNDAIYLIGGTRYNPTVFYHDVQKFTPTGGGPGGTWTAMADYPSVVYGVAAAWDGGNFIYAVGGSPNDVNWHTQAYRYDVLNDEWTQIADAPQAVGIAGAAFLHGKFYVVGGWAPNTDDLLLEYDPVSNSWAYRTGPPVPIAFPGFGTTQNDSLMFVVAGGADTPHSPLTTAVQAYDPLTDTWNQETPLPDTYLNASGNSARFVPPDKVISAGGYMLPPGQCVSLAYVGTGFPRGAMAADPVTRPLPTKFTLLQNYPNPFNATTTLSYDLPRAGHISLRVFDLLGREVAMLKEGMMEAGSHRVTYDGSNLASGIYFARLEAGSFSQTKKLMLLK